MNYSSNHNYELWIMNYELLCRTDEDTFIKHHLNYHLVFFLLFSCHSQKKRLYLQYKRKYRRTSNEHR